MKQQPLIIYKSSCGKFIAKRNFRSTRQAKVWLKEEGCHFANNVFCHLETDSVLLITEEFEYEVQASILRGAQRRKAEG